MFKQIRYVLLIAIGVLIVWYIGAWNGFLPFLGDDLVGREVGFCTMIICVTIAICTCLIRNDINKKRDK